jgi:tetratricopeptide (TPR) repeat protein
MAKAFLIAFVLTNIFVFSAYSDNKNLSEAELKKKADNYFASKKFEEALPQYSRLLSVNPENTKYIYRLEYVFYMQVKRKRMLLHFYTWHRKIRWRRLTFIIF